MTSPRIVPPDEARKLTAEALVGYDFNESMAVTLVVMAPDLAHTAAVLGEQREAILALHKEYEGHCRVCCFDESSDGVEFWEYPCPTVQAFEVTE